VIDNIRDDSQHCIPEYFPLRKFCTISQSFLGMKSLSLLIFALAIFFLHHAEVLSAQSTERFIIPDSEIGERFMLLNRSSHWKPVSSELLPFRTYHTQGMTNVNGTWFLSTVEIIDRTTPLYDDPHYDRTPGQGRGHLILFGENGKKIKSIQLGEGNIYHPGGIDSDGRYIWVPVAEYRPGSRSIIYRVNAETLEATEVFRFPDHIGAVVRDTEQNRLIGYSWGSRRIYVWHLDESQNLMQAEDILNQDYIPNPQHYIDYQDCQFLGGGMALCSGISNYTGPGGQPYPLGGIDLIDMETHRPVFQLPVEFFTDGSRPRVMTQNPFYVESLGSTLRFHFIPEDDESRHFVFEVTPE